MRIERRIFINTVVLGGGELVGQLANFGLVVLLARRFGVETLGWYAFAMALGAVLSPFVSLGGLTYLTRELARTPERVGALFAAMQPVQLTSGLLVWMVMALVALVIDIPAREALVVVIVGTYHVVQRAAAVLLVPSVARQQMALSAFVGGGHRVFIAALAAIAIFLGFDAPAVLVAMPVAALSSLVVAWLYARRGGQVPAGNIEAVSRSALIRASLPFLGTALLAAIHNRGGILLLTALQGEVATGLFAVADRLLVPIWMITGTFVAAVFPALARLAEDRDRMREIGQRSTRLLLLITIPLATLLAVFAADITTIVFGPALRSAAPVLATLAPLAVARSMSNLWMWHCVAVGDERAAALAKSRAVIGLFVLATVGILAAGAIGLAIASLAAELFLAANLRRILKGRGQCEPLWPVARGVIAGATCAALVAVLLPPLPLPGRVAVVVGTMAIATILCRAIKGHDLLFVLAILRRDPTGAALGPGKLLPPETAGRD